MSKDDYYVLVFRLLSCLHACLKDCILPNMEYLTYNTKAFPIGQEYWEYILSHLYTDGYIEGVELIQLPGTPQPVTKVADRMQITPSGVEYLQENSTMKKAAGFLKSIKETVSGM